MEISVQTIEDLLQEANEAIRIEMEDIGIEIGNPPISYVDKKDHINRVGIADYKLSPDSVERIQKIQLNRITLPAVRSLNYINFGLFFSFDAIMSYFTQFIQKETAKLNLYSSGERAIGSIVVNRAFRELLQRNNEKMRFLLAVRILAHEKWHNYEDRIGIIDCSHEGTAEFVKLWAYNKIAARRGIDLEKEKINNKIDADPLEEYLSLLYSIPRKAARKYARDPLDLLNPDIRYDIQEEIIRKMKRECIEPPSRERRKAELLSMQKTQPGLIDALRVGITQERYVAFLREFGAERMAYEASKQDCSRYLAFLKELFEENKELLIPEK